MRGGLFCDRVTLWLTLAMGVCVAATLWGDYAATGAAGPVVLDVVVGLAACALVPVLPRLPIRAEAVLLPLAALSPAATPPATAGVIAVARTRPFPVAVGVAVLGVGAHALRAVWRPMPGLSFGWWLVLVVVAHAALVGWGALVRARGELIASLEERARRAEAEQGRKVAEARAAERASIAREMHDVLAHRLSLLATYAGALEYRPDTPPERVSEAAGVIRTTVHQALDELRAVIAVLHEDEGAGDDARRPVPALRDLPALVEESRATGTRVELRDDVAEAGTLPNATGRTAYRVVQEALTNARKHAPGQPVSVVLDGTPGTRLLIDVRNPLVPDPGVTVPALPGSGTGLVGLTERVRLAGGTLDQHTVSGEFRLRASLPWPT